MKQRPPEQRAPGRES